MHIFDFSHYRKYLEAVLEASGRRSGMKSRAAEHMDTQPAFLSRVFAGQAELSLEQADKLSRFLNHTSEEHHYFLLLVQHERAGSSTLKSYFRRQVDHEREKRKNITEQVKPTLSLTPEAEGRYYSSWLYGAVHVLIGVEQLQTAEALSRALNLQPAIIGEILQFLDSCGLAKRNGDRFATGSAHLHLRNDSLHIQRHHSNWRMKAIESLVQKSDSSEIHYSAVATLDEECASRIRESLVENLKSNLKRIETAPSQTAYVYNLDFFPLIKS